VTPSDFRRIALSLPETVESAHMGHPDFRVKNRIFATVSYPTDAVGMVNLTPDQQDAMVSTHPDIFVPVPGAWGRKGCTHIRLEAVEETILTNAITTAWHNKAPPRLK